MQTEALNTQRRHFSKVSDKKLRYAKVSFVSGGGLEPAKFTDPEKAFASMSLGEAPEPNPQREVVHFRSAQLQEAASDPLDCATTSSQDSHTLPFVIDTQGGGYVPTGFPSPQIRPISPMLSDSSSEVIVFTGRNRLGRSPSNRSPISKKPTKPDETQTRTIADNSLTNNLLCLGSQDPSFLVQQSPTQGVSVPLTTERRLRICHSQHPEPAPSEILKTTYRRMSSNIQIRSCRLEKAVHEQALINDYIANIVDQGLNPEIPLSQRDLGEAENDDWLEENTNRGFHKKSLMSCWNPLEPYNFDDISTSDNIPGSLQAILSKRKIQSSLQYLVAWENDSLGGARWIPKSSLTDPVSSRLIEEFEAEEKMIARCSDCDSISDSVSSEGGSDNDTEDAEGLERQKADHTRDEEVALCLTAQGELSVEGMKDMLYDRSNGTDGEGDRDRAVLAVPPQHLHPKAKQGSRRSRLEFPNARALADEYDSFDMMDFDRPSLKTQAKGRKGKPVFGISDPELDASMKLTWEKDRSRKKKRKEERESLRVRGFLGNNKEDPDTKYKEGMGIHAVKNELKKFLKGSDTT
jgi:hypothetical protein